MNRHRCGLAHRPCKPLVALIWQTLFVQGMPPFMRRSEKTGQGLARDHARRNAVVRGAKGDRKRMGRTGQTGGVRITPPAHQQLVTQRLLRIF